MKLNNLLAVVRDAYKKRGIRYMVCYGFRVFCRTYLEKNKRFFTFQNKQYNYFYHLYNSTCLNERAVEIPIVWKIAQDYQGKRILEVGNVLSHYFNFPHDIIDKYEKFSGVMNQDIVDFQPKEKYDLIVSISTLEHVDEILPAIQNLEKCLAPGGKIVITMPLGYNSQVDNLLNEGKIKFTEQYFLQKFSDFEWKEVNQSEVRGIKYDISRYSALGLVIGIIINGEG